MPFYALDGKEPKIHETAFVHPDAVVVGDVEIKGNCYIGPGAVLRADWGSIRIGTGSNIQENCVIHARPGETAFLDTDSHVGHGALIHGSTLEPRVLVGMGSILFDHVHVGYDVIIGAGSLLLEGFKVPPKTIVAGVPAKVIGEISETQLKRKEEGTALYQTLPDIYNKQLRKIPSGEVKKL